MIRKLLATTAIAVLMTGGAYAASDTTKAETEAHDNAMIFSTDAGEPMESQNGYFTAMPGQILASGLIGQSVYASDAEDAERVGEVNDVLLSRSGTAEAVVLGVGGFLGIGEKDVAIDFERLTWVDRDGERWLTASLTKEELEQAPAFNRADIVTEEQAADNTDPAMQESAATDAKTGAETGDDAATKDMAAAETEEQPADETAAATDTTEQPMDSTAEATDGTQKDTEMAAAMDNKIVPVDSGTISAEALIGARVYGPDNQDLGEIGDVLVTAEGDLDAYLVDVGGFLGIGEKPVALDGRELKIMRDEAGGLSVYTKFTEEQLENQPAYSAEAYEADREGAVLR